MKPLWSSLAPLLLLLLSVCALAQSGREVRILIYGASTVSECAAPVEALQTELETMRFPDGWTIGIVCNPLAWEHILRIADPPRTTKAFSNLIRRSTVLNAAIFRESPAKYRRTLAHELGHVMCQCKDELRAETFARNFGDVMRGMAKGHGAQGTLARTHGAEEPTGP